MIKIKWREKLTLEILRNIEEKDLVNNPNFLEAIVHYITYSQDKITSDIYSRYCELAIKTDNKKALDLLAPHLTSYDKPSLVIENNSINAAKLLIYQDLIRNLNNNRLVFLNEITENLNEDFTKEVFKHLKIHTEDFLLDMEINHLSNASINAIAKYNENIRQDKKLKSLLHKKGFKYLELEELTKMVYGDVVAKYIIEHNSIERLANFLNELGIEKVISFELKELIDLGFGKLEDNIVNNILTQSIKNQDVKAVVTLLEYSKQISIENIISIAENWSKDNIKTIFEHSVVQNLNKNYLLQYLKSPYLNKESNYIKAVTKYTKDLNEFEELKHLLKKLGIKEVVSFNSLELIKLGFKDLPFDLIEPHVKDLKQVKKILFLEYWKNTLQTPIQVLLKIKKILNLKNYSI